MRGTVERGRRRGEGRSLCAQLRWFALTWWPELPRTADGPLPDGQQLTAGMWATCILLFH